MGCALARGGYVAGDRSGPSCRPGEEQRACRRVDLRSNKCLTCHSWANYKRSGATKISQTHFADRDFSVRANIAGSRYVCTQCHVPQVNAPVLVGNRFEPVEAIRQ